jgi:copper resistance protein C
MRKTLVSVFVLVLLAVLAGPALAHPVPESYNPGDGASLSSAPSEVSVNFNENLSQGTLEVYDPCGEQVDNGQTEIFLDEMTVGMSSDRAGTFTAIWAVVGSDSHKVSGDWTFTVSSGEPCPGAEGGTDGQEQPRSGGGAPSSDNSNDTDAGTTSSSSDQANPASGGDGEEDKKTSDGNGKHGHKSGSKASDGKESGDAEGPSVASDSPVPTTISPDQPKDIPVDWMVISFSIAALIGAVGGQIYVNLSGPER